MLRSVSRISNVLKMPFRSFLKTLGNETKTKNSYAEKRFSNESLCWWLKSCRNWKYCTSANAAECGRRFLLHENLRMFWCCDEYFNFFALNPIVNRVCAPKSSLLHTCDPTGVKRIFQSGRHLTVVAKRWHLIIDIDERFFFRFIFCCLPNVNVATLDDCLVILPYTEQAIGS